MPPNDVIRALSRAGFEVVSQKGSHLKLEKKGSPTRVVIVPMHDELAKGTLKSILEQAGLELEGFLELL
ncbi:MAG: type II toxin-antitoxin system HicA family toxin [Thermoanaerobacteraceae bacterium]|nr:type II toxin-antitoxin system HicA family toxin [Thermoanaerobacteraceae bacterium]